MVNVANFCGGAIESIPSNWHALFRLRTGGLCNR